MFEPPKSLVEAVAARTLIPFVGAGISLGVVRSLAKEFQFPDWDGLILRLAQRLEDDALKAAADAVRAEVPVDAMKAAQLAVDALGRPGFLAEMSRAFDRRRAPVGADLSAVQAIWRLDPPFVITTNYDMVLEWPAAAGEVDRIHNDDPTLLGTLDDAAYPRQRVWHLHGSIGRVDTMILTSKQYEKLYPIGSPKRVDYELAFQRLQNFLATRSFLFIGFSLKEPVLRQKLQEVLENTVHAAPIKYLLLKAGEADAAKKKEFLDDFNVQVIEFEQFGAPMVEAIHAIGRAAWPNRVTVSAIAATSEMAALARTLRDHLADAALPVTTVARVFNAAKPAAFPHALTGGDGIALLPEAIEILAGAMTPADGSLPPLLDFARRLQSEVGEPWQSRLKTWLAVAVQQLALDDDARARLGQLVAAAPAAEARVHAQVLVRIVPATTAADEWVVHGWLWSGLRAADALFGAEGRSFKAGSSGEIVYALLDELESRNTEPDLTSIAFLVPTSLACDALHRWRLDDTIATDPPIGASYTVTVRPLERLARPPLIRRRFKRAWDDLKQRAAEMLSVLDPNAPPPNAGVRARFIDAAFAKRPDLALTLDQDAVRCVVLREAPRAAALEQLTAVIDSTTMPAILWYGDDAAPPADVEQTLRNILVAGPASELPRRIRDARLEAFRAGPAPHHGAHLALIWDDADYVPPDTDVAARARVEVV